jgi:DNA-binding response OmpR family regulator
VATRVLDICGFAVEPVSSGSAARASLRRQRWDALVVDVALPEIPGYELCGMARSEPDGGAGIVVLVASVYRKTSYKRRPARLYGADDYVELHHVGDQLPQKLRRHLHLTDEVAPAEAREAARVELREEGDSRMQPDDSARLASLIVADMVLYNGDRIIGAHDFAAAKSAIADDLDIARDLFAQARQAEGASALPGDPIGDAFRRLMAELGRTESGEA